MTDENQLMPDECLKYVLTAMPKYMDDTGFSFQDDLLSWGDDPGYLQKVILCKMPPTAVSGILSKCVAFAVSYRLRKLHTETASTPIFGMPAVCFVRG